MLPRDEKLLADVRALRRITDAVLRSAEAERADRVPTALCDGCHARKAAPALAPCKGCGRTPCFACAADCRGICETRSERRFANFDRFFDDW